MRAPGLPRRILHVVGGMELAGVETWLMHVLRNIDGTQHQMDFLVHRPERCSYDDEIRALGSKILVCPDPHRPLEYARRFLQLLREHGPYEVVHSHVHHFSAFTLLLAHRAGVPVRIAHSHNDTRRVDGRSSSPKRLYHSVARTCIRKYATAGLAASADAAECLFGEDWARTGTSRVLHCAIDLRPFEQPIDRQMVRDELGIGPHGIVFGHVGRFEPQKNHAILVDIAAEIVRMEPNATFLLIGDGPLRGAVERQAEERRIKDRFHFVGRRRDVARLMLGAMDAFLFPSLYEGLGVALIEAQSAGLPCIISEAVPAEADVVPQLIHRVSLERDPAEWASIAINAAESGQRPPTVPEELYASDFNFRHSLGKLLSQYEVLAQEMRV